MPCEFSWEGSSVQKTFTGFVTGDEFVRSAEWISADFRFDSVRFILNDFRGASGHSIDDQAYLRVAINRIGAAHSNPNFRVIFIAHAGMLNVLRKAVEPSVMEAHFDPWFCTTQREANAWIGEQPVLHSFRTKRL